MIRDIEEQRRTLHPTAREEITAVLQRYLPDLGSFVLLDFPDHENVGDTAIWLGEVAYFEVIRKLSPRYVCAYGNYERRCVELGDETEPIVLHGGGNFGDIWPAHQAFREQVIRDFPHRRIVQMPQTLFFSSEEAARKTAAVVNAHPDFVLLVRDLRSLELARTYFRCEIRLCPDMAFCMDLARPAAAAAHELVLLLRQDREQAADLRQQYLAVPGLPAAVDWPEERIGRPLRARLALQSRMRALSTGTDARFEYYRELCKRRIQAGIALLSSAEYIVTDRLHAHILSTLLGISHVVLDNTYGKLSGYIATWTFAGEGVPVCKTLEEALTYVPSRPEYRP